MSEPSRTTETIEDFIDCQGKRRTFLLTEIAGGLFLSAQEAPKEDRSGLRFTVTQAPDGTPAWGELRTRIRERLAQRSVAHGPGGLTILTDVVRAQLSEASEENDEGERELTVVIDDVEISWSTLGKLLRRNVGFGFRLEIREAGEE